MRTEPFGHGVGVLLVLIAVHQLDPRRRYAIPRLLAMSLGAGLAANVVKLVIARARPFNFNFEGGVADTFGEWFPVLSGGTTNQSFPSAHTATAVGLAVGLIWIYPRGRWLFVTLAMMVACQRVESGYHYLSDTVIGAGIGLFVAMACLNDRRLAAWFGQLESHLRSRQARSPDSDAAC